MKNKKKNTLLRLPNILSLLRIFLIPLFLLMILQHKILGAFVVFSIAGLTDLLDGMTARLLHLKTKIGALLDPAADKLFMTASFIILTLPALNSPSVIPLWLTIIVISRDVFIVLCVFILYKVHGKKSFPPSLLGKTSTVCQFSVILFVLFSNSFQISSPYFGWLYILTLILTLLSAVQYFYIGYRMAYLKK